MARVLVKCVPDADKNADGFWLNRRVPAWVLAPRLDPDRVRGDRAMALKVAYGGGRFDLLTRHCAPLGHHVVQYRGTGRNRVTYRGLGTLAHTVTAAARSFAALAPTVERAAGAIRVATRDLQRMAEPPVRESRQDGGPMHARFLYPYD